MTDPTFLQVGTILRAHGRTGEVRVRAVTDRPEETFVPGVVLRAGRPSASHLPDLLLPPLEVATVRPHGELLLVGFDGFEDRTRADLLHGRSLLRDRDEVPPLSEGEVFQHDLVGRTVHLVDGSRVGLVSDVISLEPADLLEVRLDEGRKVLVPLRQGIVVRCEPGDDPVVIDPPEGLMELGTES